MYTIDSVFNPTDYMHETSDLAIYPYLAA